MKKKLTYFSDKSLVIFTISLFLVTIILQTYHSNRTIQDEQERFALAESKILNDYMFIHRNYYIDLYVKKSIKLDATSLEGLPAYSARPIAQKFSDANDYGIKIKLASDRPRNPVNLADEEELKAIDFFNKNKEKTEFFELIDNIDKPYYQYGYVLKIEKNCLVCHSKRENAPSFIRERYDKAYDYNIDDIRGIISIKIPKEHTAKYTHTLFIDQIQFNVIVFIFLFIIAIFILSNRIKGLKELEEQTEKAKKANSAKSEFLANMSHEIRTPLNAILGFVDLLKDESYDRKSLEYVDIIDSSSKNLLSIIEDILDFSKIESGKLAIEMIDFNTREELEIIIHLFDAKCSEKNISLVISVDENVPKFINTDPLRIKQVVSNLLSNAIKFTQNGKSIIIDIKYTENNLYISVQDEGKGIANDKLIHIFESFSQEDSSTTREYGGTGLGLSISSELVKLLGGELKVESTIDVGSKFYFTLPVTIGNSVKTLQDTKLDMKFFNNKVLLVEDNKSNQMFMKVILKKLNLQFDIANNGLEAIEAFKKEKYDIILMDENMPKMNGIEATKIILTMEIELNMQHTPIIALTANALKGDKKRFLDAGMDEYMTKPVKKDKLAIVLDRCLKSSETIKNSTTF